MKHPTGTFKIETSFSITRIGNVAVGQLLEGKVKTGIWMNIDVEGQKVPVKIISIERGNINEAGVVRYGLGLLIEDEPLKKSIETNRLKEQVVALYDE